MRSIRNSLDFLDYRNQVDRGEITVPIIPFRKKQNECIDENCIGHHEEYTCNPCLRGMGITDDPVSESYVFENVRNSMCTSNEYIV